LPLGNSTRASGEQAAETEEGSMTSQQFADELLHHWRNLWPLPAAERIKRIDEIRADLEFETIQQSVAEAMAEPELVE
jgi:hypothetical protein